MSGASAILARTLATLSHARHNRRGRRALIRDRMLRVLVADLVAARTAAGMTQQGRHADVDHQERGVAPGEWPLRATDLARGREVRVGCRRASRNSRAPGLV
jgi:hypothetical protein